MPGLSGDLAGERGDRASQAARLAPFVLDRLQGAAPKCAIWLGGLLRKEYAGHILRVRRDSDDAELNIDAVAATGIVDLAAIATHCGADNGYLVTAYDQSGNAKDITQATKTKQPLIYDGADPVLGAKGFLAATFDAVDDVLARADAVGLSGDVALSVVADLGGTDFNDVLFSVGPAFDPAGVAFSIANKDDQPRFFEVDVGDSFSYAELAADVSWAQLSRAAGTTVDGYEIRLDGVVHAPDSFDGTDVLSVGDTALSWGSGGGNGQRAALLVFDHILSDADQVNLDAWMEHHHA